MMSNESDTGWISLATLGASIASFVLGGLGAAFIRGMNWARVEGQESGELRIWKVSMESRMAAIEHRKDRIDEKLEQVPSRDEMNEGFNRLERQIDRIDHITYKRGVAE